MDKTSQIKKEFKVLDTDSSGFITSKSLQVRIVPQRPWLCSEVHLLDCIRDKFSLQHVRCSICNALDCGLHV